MAGDIVQNSLAFIRNMRRTRELEAEEATQNPFLAQALEREKYEGHQLAVFARTIALGILAILVPILVPQFHILFYVGIILLFIVIGWLQLRAARVGQSRVELLLIFADLALLTAAFTVTNPFQPEAIPSAFNYRFDNFIFFFLFLALGTLAYSWRTVWAMGFWIGALWIIGLVGVYFFGHSMPGLTEGSDRLYAGSELLRWGLDPNGLQISERVEEVVVVVMVGIILGLKGARSNRLLMEQASIAAERANLSRYFPSSLVDTLASKQHDIGAVRNQEVAVLFTDIVGFTQFAERTTPEGVMNLLRTYHSLVEAAVFQNGGTLDKYLGDGAMATFGTPEAGPDDAQNALDAARQILSETDKLNAQREQDDLEPVRVSVGVHFGTVTLGDVGSARRLEFTVIGDTVNVASRLEAMSRELDCKCVVSDELMKRAIGESSDRGEQIDGFEPKQGVHVRGRRNVIDVWTV
ncbi:MAG: adenylate/guanylate cyclase domain-containing protein [Alphaproteobacteria bacterium]|nr:adenylate/guanylate cyclase domain-containing protein [Alphaproteobacteria bacterium]